MKNKILTSKEFLEKSYIDITDTDIHGFHHDSNIEFLLREFAKLHAEAQVKEIVKNAKIELAKDWIRKTETINPGDLVYPINIKINEDSILNAYSLTNIK